MFLHSPDGARPPLGEPHVHTCILSRPELMAPVRAMLCELASRAGMDEIACGHVVLAVDEALTNVIRHGYKNDRDGRIWISAWELHDPAGLRIQIDDLAPQVELEQLKGRDLDDVRPGGLGIHLIHSLMDTAEFSKRPGGGMRLVIEKRLDAAANPATAHASANRRATGG
jgi:anti-sigma regulatory factor (Ser/Thr protein kinase)